MSFSIMHRMGEMESDPPMGALRALVAELDYVDPEHPDVAVTHESGWALSAFSGGLVIWENVEDDDEARHLRTDSREDVLELFGAVARGDLDLVENQDWLPGCS